MLQFSKIQPENKKLLTKPASDTEGFCLNPMITLRDEQVRKGQTMSTTPGITDINKELEMEGELSTPKPVMQEGGTEEMQSQHYTDTHPRYLPHEE